MLTCFDQLQIIAISGYSYNCSIELINKCALVVFVNVSCWSMFVESSTFLLIHNQWYLIVSSLWCGFVHNVCDAVCDGTRSTSLTLFSTMYSDYWFGDRLATRGTEKTLDRTNGISSCFCLIWPVSSTSSSFSWC